MGVTQLGDGPTLVTVTADSGCRPVTLLGLGVAGGPGGPAASLPGPGPA
jgi:hypothetical protein